MKQFIPYTIALIAYLWVLPISSEAISNKWNTSFFEETKKVSVLKIYPNPCKNNKITIEFGSQKITEFQITNIAGKRVLYKKFNYPENKKQIQLDNIQNGIYLIHLKTQENKTAVKKLIISK